MCSAQMLAVGEAGCLVAVRTGVGGAGKCCGCVKGELLAAHAKIAWGLAGDACAGGLVGMKLR